MAPLASAAFAEARLQVVALPGGVTEGIVELVARFPPPWSVDDIGAALVVKDSNGQGLAYVYYEEEPQRRTSGKMLTKDEARRIAANR
jgi:hypothetical protein